MTENVITLGHGSGGLLTHELVRDLFVRAFSNPLLDLLDDGAILPAPGGPLALTTDAFVVSPLEFSGGDIGSLAIYGTVNDLAVSGARPQHIALAAILEEGLDRALLERIVYSAAEAARRAGVVVVTGDTKVVERGKGDGVYLTTSGVGSLRPGFPRSDRPPRPGDVVLVSGPVGDHGAVILATRSGVWLQTTLSSDCGPVTDLVDALFEADAIPLFLRDPTRGGLATLLCDLADAGGCEVTVDEADIPLRTETSTICEIVGVDPLHLACEGRVVAVVEADRAADALHAWRALESGVGAQAIGTLREARRGRVVLRTRYGGARTLLRPTAELLPRIC
jgi:hydrogenase expression/formation protein HypE